MTNTAKNASWRVTVSDASPYCNDVYIIEDFEDGGAARKRFDEIAATLDEDHWVLGADGIDLVLWQTFGNTDISVDMVEARPEE